jgi:endo-1,3-1,4-beta-glycanase ExoK
MKINKYLIYFLALFFLMVSAMPTGATEYPSNGVLTWKGQTWNVRSEYGEPGPNYFSSTGAWIDNQNRMHLKIVKNKGKWKCTEIDSQRKYLYGTYTMRVASPIFKFDKNSVCGIFTYLDDSHELDIEASRWSETKGNDLWYSVQPYSIKGNNKGFLIPSSITGTNTIHRIIWKPTYIRFTTMQANGTILADFNYTNASGIPKQAEYIVMNLWLSAPPSNGKDIELIISDFSYQPSI